MNEADANEGVGETNAVAGLKTKIASLRKRKETLAGHRQTLVNTGEAQLSLTDPDSRSMQAGTGVGVGYNGQTQWTLWGHEVQLHWPTWTVTVTWTLLSELMTATSITMRTPAHPPIPISYHEPARPTLSTTLMQVPTAHPHLSILTMIMTRTKNTHYFENTGTTTEPSFIQRTDFDNPFLGVKAGGFTAPAFADLNGDDELDLIIGNQVGDIL